jgi:hypothetical protein
VLSRNEIVPEVNNPKLSSWDVVYALNMAIACLITYWIMTHTLSRFVGESSYFLGGMWAVVATVFVFRETRLQSLSAGFARLIAKCVSFALCSRSTLWEWQHGLLVDGPVRFCFLSFPENKRHDRTADSTLVCASVSLLRLGSGTCGR